jgi:hypothetical protein
MTLGHIGNTMKEQGVDGDAVQEYQEFVVKIERAPLEYPFGFLFSLASDSLVPVCAHT